MLLTELHTTKQLMYVNKVLGLIDDIREQLPLSEDTGVKYALQMLSKFEKIAGYLVQSQFRNPGDDVRFEQFVTMVKNEMPNMVLAFNNMKLNTDNIDALNKRHAVFPR